MAGAKRASSQTGTSLAPLATQVWRLWAKHKMTREILVGLVWVQEIYVNRQRRPGVWSDLSLTDSGPGSAAVLPRHQGPHRAGSNRVLTLHSRGRPPAAYFFYRLHSEYLYSVYYCLSLLWMGQAPGSGSDVLPPPTPTHRGRQHKSKWTNYLRDLGVSEQRSISRCFFTLLREKQKG